MGRNAKLKQTRKRGSQTAKAGFRDALNLANQDFLGFLKTSGAAVLELKGMSLAPYGVQSLRGLPSLERLRKEALCGDVLRSNMAILAAGFISLGLTPHAWIQLTWNRQAMRELWVSLCLSSFLILDIGDHYAPDPRSNGSRSVAALLNNSLEVFQTFFVKQGAQGIGNVPITHADYVQLTEALRAHLNVCAACHTDDVLFESGYVILYRTKDNAGVEDMTLAILSSDGLWNYHPYMHRGRIPIKDLAALRDWVKSYTGPEIRSITESRRSAKLLKWLGFEVSDSHPKARPEVLEYVRRFNGTFMTDIDDREVILRPVQTESIERS